MVTLPLPLYVTSAKCLVLAMLHGRHGQQLYLHSLHKKKTDAILGQSELEGTYHMRGRPRTKEQVSLTPLPRYLGALLPLQYLLVVPWLLRPTRRAPGPSCRRLGVCRARPDGTNMSSSLCSKDLLPNSDYSRQLATMGSISVPPK